MADDDLEQIRAWERSERGCNKALARIHQPQVTALAVEQVATLLAEVDRLKERHALALQMIEQYQIDIRDRELDRKGFCQGEYYRESSKILGIRWHDQEQSERTNP